MKKILFLAFMISTISLIGCDDKETLLDADKIPAEIKTYVEKHFPGKNILQCIKDVDGLEVSYDVVVEGGYKLEFNRDKKIDSVKGVSKLPDSVVPEKILAYVASNYPGNYIIEWDVDKSTQEVKLDNRLELVFNSAGDFLRIDD
ncbi:MAG TPA: PepSY-like domain-containing protein [Saprospiraceae bacterium]|nr:PepSY-like domain-containing protein [Saprospiraceae bacterium]HRP85154.1 PepSY-like domain-containing protein [Saprospiraceae bacterium]